jgi:hypothetical protein
LVIVIVNAIFLGACGSTPLALSATVPWRPIPASPTTSTTTTTTTLAPDPPCQASQLRAGKELGGAGAGNLATVVVLTNTGASCRLSGYPSLVGISTASGQVRLKARHGTYFGNLIPVDLAKGASGKLVLGTEDACMALNQPNQAAVKRNAASHTYTRIVIILPNGEGSLIASTYSFDVACGLYESELGVVPPPPGSEVAAPGSPGSLAATINLPTTARARQMLTYTVSLHNPTKVAVDLHRCPNYTEVLYAPLARRPTIRTYTLNCVPARPIRPSQTRVFEMVIPVPRVATSTIAKFSWQLDTGVGPYAGKALRLVA